MSDREVALEAWRAEHGDSWRLDVDPKIDAGVLLYSGSAEPDSRPEDDAGFIDAARQFIRASAALHGIDDETLVFDRLVFLPLSLIESSDKTTVRFTQEVRGVRVEGGYVNVLMDTAGGSLLSVQNTGLPGLETVDTDAAITEEGAISLAFEQLLSDTGILPEEISSPELVVSQIEDETTRVPKLTWFVQASAWPEGQELPPISIYYNFDAGSGALVRARDAVVHYQSQITGTVKSNVTTGSEALHGGSTVMMQPMSRIYIYPEVGNNPLATTNEDGTFTIYGSVPMNVRLRYEGAVTARVQNEGFSMNEYEEMFPLLSSTGNVLEMNSNIVYPTEESTAQANAYYWITRLHDWILSSNIADAIWQNSFDTSIEPTGRVNDSSDLCGATPSSSSPFYLETAPATTTPGTPCVIGCLQSVNCSNTASATIIVHEMAHILHQLYDSNWFGDSGSFSEGLADVYALYVTDQVVEGKDSCLGLVDCGNRRGDNSLRYCSNGQDFCHTGAHLGGQVLMGAFWKMRERLKITHGAFGGHVADALHNAWMNAYNTDTITAQIRKHLLILDDGPLGGGLANGTPHWADIERGFADQGFPLYWSRGLDPGIEFSSVLDPGQTTNESGPYPITADIVAHFAPPVKSARLYYRVNGGAFKPPITMTQSADTFTGVIPGPISAPAVVEYYLSATDSMNVGPGPAGQTSEYPVTIKVAIDATEDQYSNNAERRYNSDEATPDYGRFVVGEVESIFFEDFESIQPGWTHDATGVGEDDWQIATPLGLPAIPNLWQDPDAAYSGTKCAGNDLTGLGLHPGGYEPMALGSHAAVRTPPQARSEGSPGERPSWPWLLACSDDALEQGV